MGVGRHRKDGNPLGLEKRVYWHHGQFWFRHKVGKPEKLGKDVGRANERAKIYHDPGKRFGTVGYFLDLFIAEAEAGRLHKKKSKRTIADYKKHARFIKIVFDALFPRDLVARPDLITGYRTTRSIAAPVRANRELSTLSAMFSWLIQSGLCPGLIVNPVELIDRNEETPKDRYVEDGEYLPVYGLAQRSVCMAMLLAYRTLQRPEDLLRLKRTDRRTKIVKGRPTEVVSVTQGKTGRTVDIEVTPEIDEALAMLDGGRVARFSDHFIHALDGDPYTVDGIGAMLRRRCIDAGVQTFGLMDMRAKGATDLYLDGVPLETIQLLMGHKSITTTEIYIKRLAATIRIARPNTRQIVAQSGE